MLYVRSTTLGECVCERNITPDPKRDPELIDTSTIDGL